MSLAGAAAVAFAGYQQYPPLDEAEFAKASLGVSVLATGLLVVALLISKGSELLGYLIGALIALPLIGWWGGGWLNAYLDRGPPTVHVALVVNKYMTRDYPRNFYVTLASWRPNRKDVTIEDERLFGVVQRKRSLVAVTTKPGFFGFEWMDSAVNHAPAPGRAAAQPTRD